MGVHDTDKYPEIKRLLEIPEDEPIFILRAKDGLSLGLIDEYGTRYNSLTEFRSGVFLTVEQKAEFLGDLRKVQDEFMAWRIEHADQLRAPD